MLVTFMVSQVMLKVCVPCNILSHWFQCKIKWKENCRKTPERIEAVQGQKMLTQAELITNVKNFPLTFQFMSMYMFVTCIQLLLINNGPVILHILNDQVQEVLVTLWDTLVELDDLTASTNSIMMLLARILSCPSVALQGTEGGDASLTELVPRLWPFFRHNIKSVRLAALETLQTLLVGRLQHEVQYLFPIH